jgi:hypothetical protein
LTAHDNEGVMPDVFDFWKDVGPGELIHPADRSILGTEDGTHEFDLNCIPTPFYGPLKSAPIVLLYLNPGLSDGDRKAASDKAEQQFYWRQRQGLEPLRSQIGLAKKCWWVSRTKRFCDDPETLRDRLAVLQLCPYHSKSFKSADARIAARLPSYKMALDWAHDALFPAARARTRIVICLRSSKRWKLQPESREGFLFVPKVTRSGYMLNNDMRTEIVSAVQDKLSGRGDHG